MKFFNKSFLMDLFFPERQRDLLLGKLFQSLNSEGPSRSTQNTIIQLAQKYPNHQGVEQCLSQTIDYINAFYGPYAAYAITDALCQNDGSYSRVRNMAMRMAPTLVFDMSLETSTKQKIDVMTTSRQAVSICEQFMKGSVKDSIVQDINEICIKPLNSCEFSDRLKF